MSDLSKKIIQKRKSLDLSVSDVSEKTKIRSHIIEEIERGNLDVLPSVYMKAFLKTYCSFLNIPLSEIPESLQDKKPESKNKEKITFEDNDIESEENYNNGKTESTSPSSAISSFFSKLKPEPVIEEISNEPESYKELFKRKPQQKKSLNYLNIGIYSVIGIIIIVLVYFSFFYSSEPEQTNDSVENETTLTIKDTEEKKEDSKNLFNYFNKNDSLVLTAEATGQSWIRIELDGKKVDEILLQPGGKKKWIAEEFFLITQGNVGSVEFKRNGEVLPPFGNPGTVAKNIKITADTVMNTNPLNKEQTRTKVSRKKQEKKVPKRIEPSPVPSSNFMQKKKPDTLRL